MTTISTNVPATNPASELTERIEVNNTAAILAATGASQAAAPTSTAVTAGDATTPATWLAGLAALWAATPDAAHGFLTLGANANAVRVEPTSSAQTIYVAELDGATWRITVGPLTVAAYTKTKFTCERKNVAFGVAGGATVNVSGVTV